MIAYELMHDSLNHKKRWGFFTLIKFYNSKILSQKQISQFTNAIWHKVPKDDIPNNPGILKSAYLYLPHSIDKAELTSLVKNKVLSLDIPVRGGSKSYTGTLGHIPFIEELLNSHKDIELTDNEILELLEKLVNWWDADKQNLNDDKGPRLFGSTAAEFRARFANLVSALELIVIPSLNKQESVDPNILNKLSKLIQELDEYKFGTIKTKLACRKLLGISEEQIIDGIIDMLLSRDEKLILEAVNSLIYWQQIVGDCVPQKITNLLGVLALTRTEKGLVHILSALHYLQKNSTEGLTEEVIENLVSCLEKLYHESKLDSNYTEQLIAENLYLRQKASEMSKKIMETKIVSGELKSKLAVWSTTANDDSEFNEIKMGWS